MLRVVLDTSIFVSSLLVKEELPAQVLDAWRERQYLLIIFPSIIAEIRATLGYSSIRCKYGIVDEDVEQLVALLEQDALLVAGEANVAGSIPEDPADEMVLACAIDAQAGAIVSGDRHLLELGSYQAISILTARQFLERLGAGSSK